MGWRKSWSILCTRCMDLPRFPSYIWVSSNNKRGIRLRICFRPLYIPRPPNAPIYHHLAGFWLIVLPFIAYVWPFYTFLRFTVSRLFFFPSSMCRWISLCWYLHTAQYPHLPTLDRYNKEWVPRCECDNKYSLKFPLLLSKVRQRIEKECSRSTSTTPWSARTLYRFETSRIG